MSDSAYPIPTDFAAHANINAEQYKEMYQHSIDDPDEFWAQQAKKYVSWFKPWDQVVDWSFDEDDLHIEWFLPCP